LSIIGRESKEAEGETTADRGLRYQNRTRPVSTCTKFEEG
jgi:hypothetical protein